MVVHGKRSIQGASAYAARALTDECQGYRDGKLCEAKAMPGGEFCAQCERICPCCGDLPRTVGSEFCVDCLAGALCEECDAPTGSPKALICNACALADARGDF